MKGFGYQRPWVLVNDKPSYGVNGLIITSLPPITKPKMRFASEEIDGRDGDIITTLGYQAYDKTLSIGLHGNFDIDKVVEFFATSAYRFQQLENIDFERLVRYRTADVKLHVQPFKTGRLQRPKVFSSADAQAVVTNAGNVSAAPKLTIEASGNIGLYLDGSQIVSVNNTGKYTLVIDVANLEASTPEGVLMNRAITGDYQRLTLSPGKHSIKWSGTVHSLTIEDYSRWI